jgi:oligoribonuclease (3'-5' exoribonuclease)
MVGKPHLYVVFDEGGQNILKNFTIDQIFATREQAEQAGLSFVQKWIDDGKPDICNDPRRDRKQE